MAGAGRNGASGVAARFDDLTTGCALLLDGLREARSACRLDEVPALVDAAEQHARQGAWVALVVSYEAGPAFDAAQQVVPPPLDAPLAWFAAFDRATGAPAVSTAAIGAGGTSPSTVTDITRRGGSRWFTEQVDRCREVIAAGDAYQVNLTDRLDGRLDGDPADLYARMAVAQGGAFNALVQLDDRTVVSASPELFFDVRGDTVSTRPMKGTVARSARPADDDAAAEWLRSSEKDRAENVMIVDLLRNDIGRVARVGSVRVPALFDLERYETVWQLTSTVTGTIDDDVTLVDLFRALFPCGSVTGAPKIAAMHHIAAAEPWPRGVYCGAIGLVRPLVDGEVRPSATFSVAIRTAVVHHDDGSLEYGAGCGITSDSDGQREDRELAAKTAVLMHERPTFSLLETMRVEQSTVVDLHRHLDRIASSARYFGFVFDRAVAERECAASAARATAADVHRLRLLVDRTGAITVTVDRIEDSAAEVSVAIAAQRVRSDDVFMCHKTTNRGVYEAAATSRPDVDDVLLVNERDEVVESTRANVLFRIGGDWFTPPLSSGGLAGVGRQRLLADGEVSERMLALSDLPHVDELQLVSALRGRRRANVKVDG